MNLLASRSAFQSIGRPPRIHTGMHAHINQGNFFTDAVMHAMNSMVSTTAFVSRRMKTMKSRLLVTTSFFPDSRILNLFYQMVKKSFDAFFRQHI